MSRRSFAMLAASLLAGCTPASSASASAGAATLRPVCGPADEPGTMLEVPASAAEYPRFRLRVSSTLGEIAGKTIEVRDADAPGPYADWCDANDCRVIRSATPTTAAFGPMRADSSVSVQLRTTAMDGRPFRWSGIARWHGQTMLCG